MGGPPAAKSQDPLSKVSQGHNAGFGSPRPVGRCWLHGISNSSEHSQATGHETRKAMTCTFPAVENNAHAECASTRLAGQAGGLRLAVRLGGRARRGCRQRRAIADGQAPQVVLRQQRWRRRSELRPPTHLRHECPNKNFEKRAGRVQRKRFLDSNFVSCFRKSSNCQFKTMGGATASGAGPTKSFDIYQDYRFTLLP